MLIARRALGVEAIAARPVRAAARYAGPWNRRTANPVLLLNTTTDPATPYQGALALARQLGRARPLTVDGYGHTAFLNPARCSRAYTERYLIRTILPPPGTHCRGPVPFAKSP